MGAWSNVLQSISDDPMPVGYFSRIPWLHRRQSTHSTITLLVMIAYTPPLWKGVIATSLRSSVHATGASDGNWVFCEKA